MTNRVMLLWGMWANMQFIATIRMPRLAAALLLLVNAYFVARMIPGAYKDGSLLVTLRNLLA